MDVAEKLRVTHKQEHPDYKYQPRRKKSKVSPVSRQSAIIVETSRAKISCNDYNESVPASSTSAVSKTLCQSSLECASNKPVTQAVKMRNVNDKPTIHVRTFSVEKNKETELKIGRKLESCIKGESPNSSVSSVHSCNSHADHQPLTPPATPYTNNTLFRSGTPNKKIFAVGATGRPNMHRDYHSSCVLSDDSSSYCYRGDPYTTRRFFSNYGLESFSNVYPPQLHSYPATAITTVCTTSAVTNSLPPPQIVSNNYTQYNASSQVHSSGAIGATTLDTDVDLKELDQYLHNQVQIRRVSIPKNSLKTLDENMMELQPAMDQTLLDIQNRSVHDNSLGSFSSDNPNNSYFSENTYQYMHHSWGNYSN